MKPLSLSVDFNELLECDLVLLSAQDSKVAWNGEVVVLSEGLAVDIYETDCDAAGNPGNLIASGIVERNITTGWAKHVRWCCRIDDQGIRHESDIAS